MSSKYFLVRSPFRVSLFGGGTDYPEYYSNHKGAVIGFSINKYIYLGGLLTNDYVDYKYKLSYSKVNLSSLPAPPSSITHKVKARLPGCA